MKLILKKCIVNSEVDLIEEGQPDKVIANLTVYIGMEEDLNNIFPPVAYDLKVTNLNSQTGVEMDEQRMKEVLEFIENKFTAPITE